MNTIKDIAKKCHVSISTVSRALNGYSDINKDTKELVLKTADELDYIPNKNARDLVKKNNNHIAIIIKELNEECNPFQILSGLYDYVEILDYEVSLFTLGKSIKNGKSYYKFCKENNISGALLYGMEANDPYVKELIDKKFPIVLVDCDLEGEKVVNIGIDNFRVAYEVTNYMIKKGCKKIKTIQGKRSLYITKQRVRGYEQALRDNGIEINSDNIIYGEFSKQFGEKIVKSIIEYENVDTYFPPSDMRVERRADGTLIVEPLTALAPFVPNLPRQLSAWAARDPTGPASPSAPARAARGSRTRSASSSTPQMRSRSGCSTGACRWAAHC